MFSVLLDHWFSRKRRWDYPRSPSTKFTNPCFERLIFRPTMPKRHFIMQCLPDFPSTKGINLRCFGDHSEIPSSSDDPRSHSNVPVIIMTPERNGHVCATEVPTHDAQHQRGMGNIWCQTTQFYFLHYFRKTTNWNWCPYFLFQDMWSRRDF